MFDAKSLFLRQIWKILSLYIYIFIYLYIYICIDLPILASWRQLEAVIRQGSITHLRRFFNSQWSLTDRTHGDMNTNVLQPLQGVLATYKDPTEVLQPWLISDHHYSVISVIYKNAAGHPPYPWTCRVVFSTSKPLRGASQSTSPQDRFEARWAGHCAQTPRRLVRWVGHWISDGSPRVTVVDVPWSFIAPIPGRTNQLRVDGEFRHSQNFLPVPRNECQPKFV